MSDKTETKASGVRIWTGKLRLNGPRNTEGSEVNARIILTSVSIVFEIDRVGGGFGLADAKEIHAASWLRALGATGTEVP